MEAFKEKLTKLLDSKTVEAQNLIKLREHFGEENINRLPKKVFEFKIGENSWDGTNYRSINLTNGMVREWCGVASYTIDPMVTSEDIKMLEDAILKLLNEKPKPQ